MYLAYFIRSVYAFFALLALVFEAFPWTRDTFVKYGKTREEAKEEAAEPVQGASDSSTASIAGNRDSGERSESASTVPQRFAQMTVPKHTFSHFYIFGTICSALVTLDIINWVKGQSGSQLPEATAKCFIQLYISWEQRILGSGLATVVAFPHKITVLALTMYNVHIMLRLKESAYDQPATKARMHISQYAVGIIYYAVTPLAVVVDSFYRPAWKSPPVWAVIAGLAAYAYASVHQWRCHHILYNLRTQSLREDSGYVVPTGDLFAYVACPHFFCEILVYVAIWMVTGFQATTLLWNIGWIITGLGITAGESHRWYKRTFGDKYPRNRRALVPFIW
ncbi:hypothetical protein LPJ66_007480 [Kickxella alabastrina]|uniref:Uncharacterized protein n=1 Tax=Kickxella alabastrina TaxID=61397 RepID=A0ACC1IEV7_9FUNG|nr:hypothetical protein LPJ66_007480 [Kickxella alabastrina]